MILTMEVVMIREKAFHLKIRKAGIRWGCPCCSGPIGRDAKKKLARDHIAMLVNLGKVRERRMFLDLVKESMEE